MSILVVCPGCRKSFQVNEKFAGKSGPCPQCKGTIQVPALSQEVKVHTPTEFLSGGRSITGKLVTKPITRVRASLNAVTTVAIAAATVCVFAGAWAAGRFQLVDKLPVRILGLLMISPTLVLAGYTFLRNDELEPYRGRALYLRAGVCGLGYMLLWAIFAYVAGIAPLEELWAWFFVAPPFFAVGSLIGVGCLDLDFGNGFSLYAFYVMVSLALRWAAGMPWLWEVVQP